MLELFLLNFIMHAYLIQSLLLNDLTFFILWVKQINFLAPALPLKLILDQGHSEILDLLVYLNGFLSTEPCRDIGAQEVFDTEDECEVCIIQVLLLCLFDLVHAES